MKNYVLSFFVVAIALVVSSCGNSNSENSENDTQTTDESTTESANKEFDLTASGIPVIVIAPDGAEIKEGMANGEIMGVKVTNYNIVKDGFNLDVMFSDDAGNSKEELLKQAKELAEEEDGFTEFVSEEDNGFIYKLKTEDSDDYSFYYLVIKDDKPVEFGTGLNMDEYTLDQVKVMFEAAKGAK